MICGTAPPVFELHAMALDLFTRLRGSGFNVGVGELLALHRALAGGWGTDDADALARVARLIWCNSRQEQAEFDLQWQALAAYWAEHHAPSPPKSGTPAPTHAAEREGKEGVTDDSPLPSRIPPERQAELAALPVRAPFISASVTGEESIQSYWPLSRRALLYAWRYLRRPVADGPADVLDVAATVAMTVQQGFYLAPVYRRRLRNHARLLLLVDQGGSMTPFHRFTRDLIETDTDSYLSPSNLGSDPFDSDSDDDGFSDGFEVVARTNPNLLGSAPPSMRRSLGACKKSASISSPNSATRSGWSSDCGGRPAPPTKNSSAACASAKRRCGRRDMHRSRNCGNGAGNSLGATSAASQKFVFGNRRRKRASGTCPARGQSAATSTAPSENKSLLGSGVPPSSTSGEAKNGVPPAPA